MSKSKCKSYECGNVRGQRFTQGHHFILLHAFHEPIFAPMKEKTLDNCFNNVSNNEKDEEFGCRTLAQN